MLDVVHELVAEVLEHAAHRHGRRVAERADRAALDVEGHAVQQRQVFGAALAVLDPAGAHDVVINLQGDMPFADPGLATACAALLPRQEISIALLKSNCLQAPGCWSASQLRVPSRGGRKATSSAAGDGVRPSADRGTLSADDRFRLILLKNRLSKSKLAVLQAG